MQSSAGPYREERSGDREGWRAVFSAGPRDSESAQLQKNKTKGAAYDLLGVPAALELH